MIIGSIILDDEIHEIKDEDAFHLTVAIEGKTEYFVTVDDNILTKADKIERYGIKENAESGGFKFRFRFRRGRKWLRKLR